MDNMRWREGDTHPVNVDVREEVQIDIGDLIWLAETTGEPFSNAKYSMEFAVRFLGVAMQRSRIGAKSRLRVATAGVFEFAAGPATCEIGDGIIAIANQSVIVCPDVIVEEGAAARRMRDPRCIGRIVRRETNPAAKSVWASIRSQVMQ
jgi:hypothetical protein